MCVKNLQWAIDNMKNGFCVRRNGWNGKRMYIKIQNPDKNSFMTAPYVYIEYPEHNYRIPWLCSQEDLLAEDYEIYTFDEGPTNVK